MGSVSNPVDDLLKSAVQLPDYLNILSRAGKRITDNKLRTAFKNAISGKKKILFTNGMPNQEPLPVACVQFTLKDGSVIQLSQQEISAINNYGFCEGLSELRSWLMGLHKLEHKPPQLMRVDHPETFQLTITNGITEAVRSCFHLLLDEGDSLLVEEETYSNIITLAELFGANPVAVRINEKGMIAEDLDEIMSTWSHVNPQSKPPRVMYTITSCSNPTGYTWSEESMAKVYKVCRKYDIIIIEDAAYYFLQFGQRHRSFQSIDVDGRVIRMDTFSKTIGAGYRVGWISGPNALVERYVLSMSQNTVHPCVLSQVMINHILQSWGYEKFNQQMTKVAEVYRKKAEHIASMIEKYLKGLVTLRFPSGGMFMWIKINDCDDTADVMVEAEAAGVSVISGDFFTSGFKPSSYIRLSFSMVDKVEVEKGIKIMADVLTARKNKKP
ncbi:hypothetical protein Btru_062460 [Bulinus truncatus]|nr:hypothetical protein Btru_062460 [Bulinus truncatus]